MKFIVDRIEGDFAVLEREDGFHIDTPLSVLPVNLKEGNILFFDGTVYNLDTEEEQKRRKRNLFLQKKLFSKEK